MHPPSFLFTPPLRTDRRSQPVGYGIQSSPAAHERGRSTGPVARLDEDDGDREGDGHHPDPRRPAVRGRDGVRGQVQQQGQHAKNQGRS
ncbi:MAG: hypothetical protein ACRDRU_17010 [Pseudonocardiaceae bacterium]